MLYLTENNLDFVIIYNIETRIFKIFNSTHTLTRETNMLLFKKSKTIIISSSILLSLSALNQAYAQEDPTETCASAVKLFKDGDIEGALEEARWCVTQLEQLKQGQTATFFKDEILGYTGGKLDSQQTMGMSIMERSYSKDNSTISVSMSGGAAGNAMNNIFGTIASMGLQGAAGKKVRIQRRSAVVSEENGTANIIITLKSGGILTISSSNVSSDEVLAFAKAFPVAELDDSRG